MKRVIRFTRLRYVMISISVALILCGVVAGIMQGGFNVGVDFRPGLTLQVQVDPQKAQASIGQVRQALAPLEKFDLQSIGSTQSQQYTVKVQAEKQEPGFQKEMQDRIMGLLSGTFGAGTVVLQSSDFVGPQFSQELAGQTVSITMVALILILIYAAFRFQFNYGAAAVLCLLHDAAFIIAWNLAFHMEFNTVTIATVLTIIGYSINDTIVIFDRVRENLPLMHDAPIETVFDTALTQTLSRTILTSFTVLMSVLVLFFFGTGSIKDFSTLMLVGVVEGSYSTIFIASPIVIWLEKAGERRRRKRDVKKFGTFANRPDAVRPAVAEHTAEALPADADEASVRPAVQTATGTDHETDEHEDRAALSISRSQPSRKKKKKKR